MKNKYKITFNDITQHVHLEADNFVEYERGIVFYVDRTNEVGGRQNVAYFPTINLESVVLDEVEDEKN